MFSVNLKNDLVFSGTIVLIFEGRAPASGHWLQGDRWGFELMNGNLKKCKRLGRNQAEISWEIPIVHPKLKRISFKTNDLLVLPEIFFRFRNAAAPDPVNGL